jgi:transcriptional regulator with XRE-family HTH domain
MIIGERLRQLREDAKLSQGHIETKTGLLRCYISRVENGHTVPSIETLEKLARALEVPLHQIFMAPGDPAPLRLVASVSARTPDEDRQVAPFRRLLRKMGARDRKTLLTVAHAMARQNGRKKSRAA